MADINSTDNQEFLNAIEALTNGDTTSVNVQTGVVSTATKDGEIVSEVDVSEETKPVTDKIEEIADTDDTDDSVEEHTNEDDNEEEVQEGTPDLIEEDTPEEEVTEDISEEEVTEDTPESIEKDDIDYKGFYEKVTSKIKVNGLEVDGINDPSKLVELQERWMSDSRKLDEYDKVRPLVEALNSNGLVDDPDKFGFAMELLSGNKAAINVLLKNNNIDPLELDVEGADEKSLETGKHYVSPIQLEFNDFIDESKGLGVFDDFNGKLLNDWDNQSLEVLLNDKVSRQNLLKHLKTGLYDSVTEEIRAKEATDISGSFKSKNLFDKYSEASMSVINRLTQQNAKKESSTIPAKKKEVVAKKVKVAKKKKNTDKERIVKARVASEATKISGTPQSDGSSDSWLDEDSSDEEFYKQMLKLV